MANDLVAPFKKIAEFFGTIDNYQMVPFGQWEVRNLLNRPNPPKLPNVSLTFAPGLPDLLELIPGAGGVLGDLKKLLDDVVRGRLNNLAPDLARLVPDSLNFVRQQVGLGLSLVALLDIPRDAEKIAPAVTAAYQAYFFGDAGFMTLEGGKIAAPTFDLGFDSSTPPSLAQIASEVRKFASHKTADQYIRDLIRITVEASSDALFDLSTRYKRLTGRSDELGKQEQSWFKGFANLAESTVTSTVEEAAQGVAAFSTNPLIAASLSTFAGTAARKLTQNAFLLEINL